MSNLIEYFKKDKLKASVIIASIFLFIVGIIVTAINSGGTYAYEYGDSVGSVCPIGGTIEYNKSYGEINNGGSFIILFLLHI